MARKAQALLAREIRPIVCIGETLAEREAGQTFGVLERQLAGSLARVPAARAEEVVIAYEPVWAIGTGRTATPEIAQEAHAFVRDRLVKRFGAVSKSMRIQYGGSVKPENVDDADGDARHRRRAGRRRQPRPEGFRPHRALPERRSPEMTTFLTILHVIVCVFLIAVVLLQRGKGAEIGAVFGGGGSSTVFGSRGAGNFLSKLTTGAAIVFMITSLSLAYLWTMSSSERLFDEAEEAPAARRPASRSSRPRPRSPPRRAPAGRPPAPALPPNPWRRASRPRSIVAPSRSGMFGAVRGSPRQWRNW